MAKFNLIIAFFFFVSFSFGQIEKQLNVVLLKRDFKEFKKIVDSFKLEKNKTTISNSIFRDITNGFQESVFYVTKAYPINGAASITCKSRINIITEGNLIIYFHLESKEIKDFPKAFNTTSDTTYNFSDQKKMAALKLKFRQSFLTSLNEKSLFIDTIYYSYGEVYKGHPNEQMNVNFWVNSQDTSNLYNWLQSTNTEQQIYAVSGFNSLLQKGIKLNQNTSKIIKRIIKKAGFINTMIPCDAGLSKISTIVKSFKFINKEK